MLRMTRLTDQVDTRFGRVAGGAFPSSLPKVYIDGTRGETWNLCSCGLTGVYSISLSQPRPRFGWLLSANELSPKYLAGVEPVAGVKSKMRQDITPVSDADPLFGPVASEVVRYLASIAM